MAPSMIIFTGAMRWPGGVKVLRHEEQQPPLLPFLTHFYKQMMVYQPGRVTQIRSLYVQCLNYEDIYLMIPISPTLNSYHLRCHIPLHIYFFKQISQKFTLKEHASQNSIFVFPYHLNEFSPIKKGVWRMPFT